MIGVSILGIKKVQMGRRVGSHVCGLLLEENS